MINAEHSCPGRPEAIVAAARKQLNVDRRGSTADTRAQAKDQVSSAQRQLSQARSSYSNTVAQSNFRLTQSATDVTVTSGP